MPEYKINIAHFGFKKEDIKYEILSQTSDRIQSRTTYPNGLILYFDQTAEEVSLDSNWVFSQEADGSLTPIAPKQ